MEPLVVLSGPTAVGKTKLSIELAKTIGGEIISADSMQVYKNMDIGTAKITEEEKQGVPHFLIDEFYPDEEFNVMIFQSRVFELIKEIRSRGHIPMLVGGTGFYIQAVVNGIEFTEQEEDGGQVKERLMKEMDELGPFVMFERLKAVDEPYTRIIHMNNKVKVIRALEYYELTGKRFSDHNREQEENKHRIFNTAYFVLNTSRDILYSNIEKRVDLMLEAGLVNEVKGLLDAGYDRSLTSMQGLGYKEIAAYLCGECSLDEAAERIKHGTKLFAKRQLTWFKREKDVIFIDKTQLSNDNSLLRFCVDILEKQRII